MISIHSSKTQRHLHIRTIFSRLRASHMPHFPTPLHLPFLHGLWELDSSPHASTLLSEFSFCLSSYKCICNQSLESSLAVFFARDLTGRHHFQWLREGYSEQCSTPAKDCAFWILTILFYIFVWLKTMQSHGRTERIQNILILLPASWDSTLDPHRTQWKGIHLTSKGDGKSCHT